MTAAETHSPVLLRLASSGRATLAERPGYRPPMRPGDGTGRLSDALAGLRDGPSQDGEGG